MGHSSNGAYLLQLVQADGGHLTGRYEEVIVQPDGKRSDLNASVSGAVDGPCVVVRKTAAAK